MTTAAQLLSIAYQHIGEKYELGAQVQMNDPNWQGPWDCSEFVTYCVFQVTGKLYGYGDRESGAYTGFWYDDAVNGIVTKISVNEARQMQGAILLRRKKSITLEDGTKEEIIGHIAITDGNGRTVEARGRRYGVCEFVVGKDRGWDCGILIPSITYPQSSQLIDLDNTLELRSEREGLTSTTLSGTEIKIIKQRLKELKLYQGDLTNSLNANFKVSLFHYQLSKGLESSGMLDDETRASILEKQ